MKKYFISFFLIYFFITFSSCSNSIEKDGIKMGELKCERNSLDDQRILNNFSPEDENKLKEKINQNKKNIEIFEKEIEKKYTTEEQKKIYENSFRKTYNDCILKNLNSLPNQPKINKASATYTDCNKYINDYEELTNNYILLIEKEKSNPDNFSLASEHMSMASKIVDMQLKGINCMQGEYFEKFKAIITSVVDLISSKSATQKVILWHFLTFFDFPYLS